MPATLETQSERQVTKFISMRMMLETIVGSIIFGPFGESFGYHWPLLLSGMMLMLIPFLLNALNGLTKT
jgi:hypothetical protein